MAAFESFAAAAFNLNRPGQNQRAAALRALCNALQLDPNYEAPRLLLTEYGMTELVEAEPDFARSLLEALSSVQAPHIIFDLLRFEANLVLDKTSAASSILDKLRRAQPDVPGLSTAAARLETHVRQRADPSS